MLKKNFQVDEERSFWKTLENVTKHRDTNLAATEVRKNYWCQNQTITRQKFFGRLLAIEKKNYLRNRNEEDVVMNKSAYIGLSI